MAKDLQSPKVFSLLDSGSSSGVQTTLQGLYPDMHLDLHLDPAVMKPQGRLLSFSRMQSQDQDREQGCKKYQPEPARSKNQDQEKDQG